jgi:integrase
MGRFQNGTVYLASGSFFVRYYESYNSLPTERRAEIAKRCEAEGTKLPSRVLVSQRLCVKDDRHHSSTCKPVRRLAAAHMAQVNERTAPVNYTTVAEFWRTTYEPFITEQKKFSTVHGYKQIWESTLKSHFGSIALKDYRTPDATVFLTGIAKTVGQRTVSNIRSVASAIFSHAVALGVIDSNPWHDAKVLCKMIEPGETGHYSLQEAEAIVSALIDHLDAQLMFCFSFFVGLRTSEIQGLMWEDFDTIPDADGIRWVHICRGIVRNRVADTKTRDSAAALPLIRQVLIPLVLWWKACGQPISGWLFPNSKGKPRDPRTTINSKIIPALKAKNIEWRGFYCGRRGSAKLLASLTKTAMASKELLRHTTSNVTEKHYIQRVPEELLRGMKLLEAASSAHQPQQADTATEDSN